MIHCSNAIIVHLKLRQQAHFLKSEKIKFKNDKEEEVRSLCVYLSTWSSIGSILKPPLHNPFVIPHVFWI